MSLDGTGIQDDIGGLDEMSPSRRRLFALGARRGSALGVTDIDDAPPIIGIGAGGPVDNNAPPPVRPAGVAPTRDMEPGWSENIPALGAGRSGLLAPVPENFQGTAVSDAPAGAGIPAPPPIRTQPSAPSPAGGNEPPPVKPPGYAERFAALQAERPRRDDPKFAVPGWKKGLGFAAATLAGTFNPRVDAGELYSNVAHGPYNRAEHDWEQRGKGLEEEAKLADTEAQMRQRDEAAALAKSRANRPEKRQFENIQQLHADAVQDAINRGVDPAKDPKVLQVEDSIQRIQREPAQRPAFTNPFEAFTFGTPEQKKSAQDFLQFEKRMDRQNQKPTEAEFRYSLYQRDPETYKAMYGDKGQAADERSRVADRTHATRMLTYFGKRRDEISKDYTLGDDEKKQQLAEVDELEKPFMDTATAEGGNETASGKVVSTADILAYAQKNGVSSIEARKHFNDEGYRIVPVTPATAHGKDTDRVNVVSPDGIPGSIPRSQLKKAKGKGYKEAPAQ